MRDKNKDWLFIFCAGGIGNIIFGIVFAYLGLLQLLNNSISFFVLNTLYAIYALLMIKGIIKND